MDRLTGRSAIMSSKARSIWKIGGRFGRVNKVSTLNGVFRRCSASCLSSVEVKRSGCDEAEERGG
jgi:hypothetical protein